jgi:hypothetical protein
VKSFYAYTVDDAVLLVFAEGKKRHREELLRIFGRLANDPFVNGNTIHHTYDLLIINL